MEKCFLDRTREADGAVGWAMFCGRAREFCNDGWIDGMEMEAIGFATENLCNKEKSSLQQ